MTVRIFLTGRYSDGKYAVSDLSFAAIIKGVDEYAPLLRISAASAGNDTDSVLMKLHLLLFQCLFGDELQAILDAIENGTSVAEKFR